MGFMRVAIVGVAPILAILAAMGSAFLDESHGTGKNLANSKAVWYVIIALATILTCVFVFKTPLGAPIFELLGESGAGSLIIFSGSVGIPLPLALLAILVILLLNVVTAAGTAFTLVLLADVAVGFVKRMLGR